MSGRQEQAFLAGEGRAWLERNKEKLPIKDDPVLNGIDVCLIEPKRVLEVGCADGWRLKEIAKRFHCSCSGIDPGITHTHHVADRVTVHRGTASNLNLYSTGSIDLLIYGFCLYLCDPEDYLKIAAEGDRVLAHDGYLVVYDFYTDVPHSRVYTHKEGIFSHKMDFQSLWSKHPFYSLCHLTIIGEGEDATSVTILRKDMRHSFPVIS